MLDGFYPRQETGFERELRFEPRQLEFDFPQDDFAGFEPVVVCEAPAPASDVEGLRGGAPAASAFLEEEPVPEQDAVACEEGPVVQAHHDEIRGEDLRPGMYFTFAGATQSVYRVTGVRERRYTGGRILSARTKRIGNEPF